MTSLELGRGDAAELADAAHPPQQLTVRPRPRVPLTVISAMPVHPIAD